MDKLDINDDQQQLSPWLSHRLLVHALDVCEDDARNSCNAWIIGTGMKKECMSRLPGGVHSDYSSQYYF